jgi:hypothetical protein
VAGCLARLYSGSSSGRGVLGDRLFLIIAADYSYLCK